MTRACTHKVRLFGNRWLMSALSAEADIDRTIASVSFVPILLQKYFWGGARKFLESDTAAERSKD